MSLTLLPGNIQRGDISDSSWVTVKFQVYYRPRLSIKGKASYISIYSTFFRISRFSMSKKLSAREKKCKRKSLNGSWVNVKGNQTPRAGYPTLKIITYQTTHSVIITYRRKLKYYKPSHCHYRCNLTRDMYAQYHGEQSRIQNLIVKCYRKCKKTITGFYHLVGILSVSALTAQTAWFALIWFFGSFLLLIV